MSRPDLEAGQQPPASESAARATDVHPADGGDTDVVDPTARTSSDDADVADPDAESSFDVAADPDDELKEDDDVDDVDDVGDDDEPVGRRPWWLYGLALASTVLLVAVVLLGLQVRADSLDDNAREAGLTAARQSALNLTSIDQEDFDGDVARVLDGATGEFRQDFQARSADLQTLLDENEVSAEGTVLEAAIIRSDRQSATVLVVVDSTVSNSAAPEGRVNSYRMRLEVERVGDSWLTSQLEFVG